MIKHQIPSIQNLNSMQTGHFNSKMEPIKEQAETLMSTTRERPDNS